MGAQGVNINVLDNALGQSAPGQGTTLLVVGTSGSGAANTSLTSTKPNDFLTTFGPGIGPRMAAFIANQTGNPVTFAKASTVGAGTITAVGKPAGNTSTSVLTISGTPNDDLYLLVKVLTAVTVGQAGGQIGISLDGGTTFAYTVNLPAATPATVTAGSAFTTYTGLSLSFAAGTLVQSDTFYAVGAAPTWNDAGVLSAIQAASAIKSVQFRDVIIAGVSAGSDATAFDGYMTTLANGKRWARLLCGARDATWGGASTETEAQWMTSIQADFQNVSALRVGVAAGHYRFIDPFTQSQQRSSLLFGAAARDSAVAIQIDLGQVSSGAIANVVLPTTADTFANGTQFYHDESQNPGLDAARFLSSWQIVGLPGIYIMNPNLMAPPGSDFNWLQNGHVIDSVAAIAYNYFVKQLSSSVRVSAKTGFIIPQDRNRLQNGCQAQLNNILVTPGAVSAATCMVAANDNILSTSTLTVTISVVPLGYLKAINVTITFLNPAVVAVQTAA